MIQAHRAELKSMNSFPISEKWTVTESRKQALTFALSLMDRIDEEKIARNIREFKISLHSKRYEDDFPDKQAQAIVNYLTGENGGDK